MKNVITLDKNIKFVLDEYNARRNMRGAEAARVFVSYDDGKTWDWLWMSKKDIRKNIMEFGRHEELLKALDAYKSGQSFSGRFREKEEG